MKKILIAAVSVTLLLLAVLFIPIPRGTLADGTSREWRALTYKIIDWNIETDDGNYEKCRFYFGSEAFKPNDELSERESENIKHVLKCRVDDKYGDLLSVKPLEGEAELEIADSFKFSIKSLNLSVIVGDFVNITYMGNISSESGVIDAVSIEVRRDLRPMDFYTDWIPELDMAEFQDITISADFIITEIYADCFFAKYVTPMPNTIKINGALSSEWCVGDQVLVTYKNIYTDIANNKMECELVSIEESTFELEPGVAYKPVIYLYPEEVTRVNVTLDLDGKLTTTYPKYEGGWSITAFPDGTLRDDDGKIYNYLYWEGETYAEWSFDKGFCVKGEDSAEFLEDALAKLGLSRREANEFIVYWLPMLEKNPYNIISFQTDIYTDAAKLNVSPSPDTKIRVFMAFKSSISYAEIQEQELKAPERVGFTVVEWGGTEVK